MSEVTLDGNPPASALSGSEIFALIQSGLDASATVTQVITLVNAIAQLASTAQVTGLPAALAAKLDLSGGTMTGTLALAGNPVGGNDAANKIYVDASAVGHVLPSCYAATTANLTATYANGASGVGATLTNSGTLAAFTTDGTTPPINSLIFVPFQSSMLQNGLFTLTTVGSGAAAWVLTRPTFYDQPNEIKPGDQVVIQNGTTYASSTWIQTATVTTVGTDPLSFTQTNILNAGTGLTKTGTTLSITNTAVTAGTYNNASKTFNATVNAQGQLTGLALVSIAITASQVTDFDTEATVIAEQRINAFRNAPLGIAGLNSTYRILFYNSAGGTQGTIPSTLVNANTGIREYAFNDRDGVIADDTDLALKEDKANKNALNGYPGLAVYKIQFGNLVDNSNPSFLTHANSAVRTYTFQDRTGTIADLADIATKANTGGSNATGTWPISISGGSATVITVPALTGDITTTGSTNATTLKNTGSAGTYTKVTTDAAGRVSSGTTLVAGDIPTLTAAKISDFDTQVATDIAAAVGVSVQAFNTMLKSLSTVKGSHSISGATDQTLTNPMSQLYTIGSMSPGTSIILPAMNATNSPEPVTFFVFVNNDSLAHDIKLNDTTTVLVSQLAPGAKVILMLTGNSSNGTWTGLLNTSVAAITSGSINGITSFSSNAASNSFGTTNSGAENNILVTNPSNTASSDALIKASVGGGSAGDAYYQAIINGATTWSWGAKNSDSDAWVLSANAALGTTNVLRASTGGQITKPKQSAFSVYNSTTRSNVTGDGTNYTIPYNTAVFDQNSDFNTTTGTFTAPVTGKYSMTASAFMAGLTALHTSIIVELVTSNRTYQLATGNGSMRDVNNNLIIPIPVLADMDTGDTATILVNVAGSTKVVSISSTPADTTFTGYLAV